VQKQPAAQKPQLTDEERKVIEANIAKTLPDLFQSRQ
jgi:hypothetical protein